MSGMRGIAVQHKALATAATVVMIGGVGCSVGRSTSLAAGPLPAGTAQVTMGNNEPLEILARCAPAERHFTTITAGGDAGDVMLMVSNTDRLALEFVRIRNVEGFNGDFNRGLGDDATITRTENTYDIAGSALGYHAQSSDPVIEPFTMKVVC